MITNLLNNSLPTGRNIYKLKNNPIILYCKFCNYFIIDNNTHFFGCEYNTLSRTELKLNETI